MSNVSLAVLDPRTPPKLVAPTPGARATVALVGNPNTGKTSLFNALTGLRAKTANFAGTTVDVRIGKTTLADRPVELIDLPGLYSLEAATEDERVAVKVLHGLVGHHGAPDAIVLVLDATNLERSLYLASQVLALGRPTVAAINLVDAARRLGIKVDKRELTRRLGCEVVLVSARTGEGLDDLKQTLVTTLAVAAPPDPAPLAPLCEVGCNGCAHSTRYAWAEGVASACAARPMQTRRQNTERLDAILTHPVGGVVAFLAVMIAVFYLIFAIADIPMGLIEAGFAWVGDTVAHLLPEGDVRSLIVDGVIGGVGGVLVFLPQIVILFFAITLLEDTGYLARAAFVMDRLMRKVGLPGKAFVPMLSAHACAIPAIMASRIIEDRRDRLVTILVTPLLTCSARLPVYAMVVALLFAGEPLKGALAWTGAYCLGIVAALSAAFVLRKTILPGESRPMVIELPDYRLPSIRNALLHTYDRAMVFVKKAGTVILLLSILLWAMSTYPKLDTSTLPAGTSEEAAAQLALEHSVAGRLGHALEPVFAPLGFNWQVNVGVVASFAARETIVSTLGIVYGLGDVDDTAPLTETLAAQTRADGTPVFNTPTALSLLVFYVLAMMCLPTQAVTRREAGSWKWAALQVVYMTSLAYVAALATHAIASALV